MAGRGLLSSWDWEEQKKEVQESSKRSKKLRGKRVKENKIKKVSNTVPV